MTRPQRGWSGAAEDAVDGDLDGNPVRSVPGLAVAGGVAGDGGGDSAGVTGDRGGTLEGQPAPTVDLADDRPRSG